MCTYAQSFTTWVCSCGVLIVGVQLSARMLKYSINGVQASVPASSVDIEGSSFFLVQVIINEIILNLLDIPPTTMSVWCEDRLFMQYFFF